MGCPPDQQVAQWLHDHGLATPDVAILLLVSGGADSMCLLDVMSRVHSGRLGVLTFDHGLRPQSTEETRMVQTAAAQHGHPAWVEQLHLTHAPGVQAAARTARQARSEAVRDREGFSLIATGHTASDQVETILFRLARGTGRTGAVGIRDRAGNIIRPLLGVTRAQAREWCQSHGIPFVDDPTNSDLSAPRARARHRVAPAFAELHPGAENALRRFAAQLADEQEILDVIVDEAWDRARGEFGLEVAQLRASPPALTRLLVRRLLTRAGVPTDARWVAAACELADAGEGRIDMPGARVEVVGGWLCATSPSSDLAADPVDLTVPGTASFAGHRITAELCAAGASTPTVAHVAVCDDLQVRGPRPGDRIGLAGGGRAAVGRLLAGRGVPAAARGTVPLVVANGRVVWIAGYRADPQSLAAPGEPAIRLEVM